MITADVLSSILQSLVDITRKLCAEITSGDFFSIAKTLEQREQLLSRQKKMAEEWRLSLNDPDDKNREAAQLAPLAELLKQVDNEFVTLFTEKKDELAEKLKQAHNQSLLLVYSR